jgi:hypothetical protein
LQPNGIHTIAAADIHNRRNVFEGGIFVSQQ